MIRAVWRVVVELATGGRWTVAHVESGGPWTVRRLEPARVCPDVVVVVDDCLIIKQFGSDDD